MIEPDDIFVGRALALGRGAPTALQIIAIPHREHRVGVVGIDDEQHVSSSALRREDFAGGDAPAALGAVEQQGAVVIEIEKPAVERLAFEADSDALAEAARALEPGGAHRREPLLPPMSGPAGEAMREGFEQPWRRYPVTARLGERGGGELDIARR